MHVIVLSLVLGVGLGVVAVLYGGRNLGSTAGAPSSPSPLAWAALGFGAVSLLFTAAGFFPRLPGFQFQFQYGTYFSMTGAIAAAIAGVSALRRGDRSWPAWAGLVAGGLPLAFWVYFVVAEALYPH